MLIEYFKYDTQAVKKSRIIIKYVRKNIHHVLKIMYLQKINQYIKMLNVYRKNLFQVHKKCRK